jgi:hypothetical protein
VSGRLRAPWRTKPALHVHAGITPALRWDARAEVLELPRGPTEALDPVTAARAVHVLGSKRLAAAALGVTRQTVSEISGIPMPFGVSHAVGSASFSILLALHPTACDTAKGMGIPEISETVCRVTPKAAAARRFDPSTCTARAAVTGSRASVGPRGSSSTSARASQRRAGVMPACTCRAGFVLHGARSRPLTWETSAAVAY